jgi:hypothetical protein
MCQEPFLTGQWVTSMDEVQFRTLTIKHLNHEAVYQKADLFLVDREDPPPGN